MGLEKELEFREGRVDGLSPNTVLPSPRHCLDVEKRSAKGKPARNDNRLSLKEDFKEISFGRYRSSSCNVEMKRGSIYQSSREVSKMKKRGSVEGRRKIEMPRSSGGAFSFSVVDSLCDSDEENQRERSSVMSRNSNLSVASVSKAYVDPCSSGDFFEICLDSNNGEKCSSENVGRARIENVDPLKKVTSFAMHKSLSAKAGLPQLPSLSESDHSPRASSKSRFSPIRKMFDPFMKSKSLRSPLSDTMEVGDSKRNKALLKPLPDDFSKAPDSELISHNATRDRQHSLVAGSPVHLHACLKMENKGGMPYFEFSLKCPEEVFVAKTWKADKAFNWVYTFHSMDNRKRSNANSRVSNDGIKESPMVGQMQVACYLCSELRDEKASENSMVTEFVMYDIAHARNSVAVQDVSNCSPDLVRNSAKVNPQPKQVSDNRELDSSCLFPWAPADLHPNLEIAATVIQVPFEKRESLKYKRGGKISEKKYSNLLKLSRIEQKGRITDNASPAKVKVVIPSGNHGLPSDESRGPSSLLNRWRLGGGCDCGGWDMACPLVVFGNPDLQSGDDHLLVENQRPLELFVQGSKENAPGLTLTYVQEGEYSVDFHAQLSTVQAFSICVAMLHSTQASTAAGQERNGQLPQCNSLKMFIDEEVKFLIKAVTEEEKITKTRKAIPASFVLNPPFSPIARV